GEPIGEAADHARLSAGLDQRGQKTRLGDHAGRHKYGSHAGQHRRRKEAVAPQPLPPDRVGPVRRDTTPLPSLPRWRGSEGRGPRKQGLITAHRAPFARLARLALAPDGGVLAKRQRAGLAISAKRSEMENLQPWQGSKRYDSGRLY